jgi:hypothetical protein
MLHLQPFIVFLVALQVTAAPSSAPPFSTQSDKNEITQIAGNGLFKLNEVEGVNGHGVVFEPDLLESVTPGSKFVGIRYGPFTM